MPFLSQEYLLPSQFTTSIVSLSVVDLRYVFSWDWMPLSLLDESLKSVAAKVIFLRTKCSIFYSVSFRTQVIDWFLSPFNENLSKFWVLFITFYVLFLVNSFVELTRMLLQDEGVIILLKKKFLQDPLEKHFTHRR